MLKRSIKVVLLYIFVLLTMAIISDYLLDGIYRSIGHVLAPLVGLFILLILNRKKHLYDGVTRISIRRMKFIEVLLVILFIVSLYIIRESMLFSMGVFNESIKESKEVIASIIVSVIVSPLSEEVIFRGLILTQIQKKYGSIKAAVFTSILFSLMHLQINDIGSHFVLSIVFCHLYIISDNILLPVIAHIASNASGIVFALVSFYGSSDIWFYQGRFIFSNSVFLAGLFMFVVILLIYIYFFVFRGVYIFGNKKRTPIQDSN